MAFPLAFITINSRHRAIIHIFHSISMSSFFYLALPALPNRRRIPHLSFSFPIWLSCALSYALYVILLLPAFTHAYFTPYVQSYLFLVL